MQPLCSEAALISPRRLVQPAAWVGHIPFASWLVSVLRPATFVELGTHSGNSYLAFCQAIDEQRIAARAFAVDTWLGDLHSGQYEDDIFLALKEYHDPLYGGFSQLLRMTFDEAAQLFPDASVDLLHIDGLHTYEAVKHDFATWLPKMSRRGVVLFHDTNVGEADFGVHRVWAELRAEYPGFCFEHSHGLGVVLVGADTAPQLRELAELDPASAEWSTVSRLFTALGDRLGAELTIQDLTARLGAFELELARLRGEQQPVVKRRNPVIGHQLRRAQRAVQLIGPALRQAGGPVNAIEKALRLYRSDGLRGIRRGLQAVALRHANPRNDYTQWVRQYDSMSAEARAAMRARIEHMTATRVSIIMPVFNPKPAWLQSAIDSVRNQIYPHWELCIADDHSSDREVLRVLERYAALDPRIKVMYRDRNGHIAEASNSALSLASGEWVALLDHDDVVPEHALFWVADAIERHPKVQLIYSDEDKIDDSGRRFGPYFKCDWNPDLFYSHNLFCHLGVYRRSLVASVGGFSAGSDGAQDYDLTLRCIEKVSADEIHHIPRVLYHWRAHAESTARSAQAKPYAMQAGEAALNRHFKRLGNKATASLVGHGYRVRHDIPNPYPNVTLIVPTRNALEYLQPCLESILKKTTYPAYEILIVDNGSDDARVLRYLKSLQVDRRVRVIRDDRPFNYSALNNAAVQSARGDVIGLLNNDLQAISADWLHEMVSHALRPDIGAVGARLWYPNDTLQHGGVVLGIGGAAGHAHKGFPKGAPGYVGRMELISNFSAVTGACLLVRKALYEEVGGLNERELAIALSDVDFCLRLREAGYRNVWTPYAELYHHESASRGYEDTPEKKARFAAELAYLQHRWGDLLSNDPAYSPNLTLDREDFSLAWPPRVTATTDGSSTPIRPAISS